MDPTGLQDDPVVIDDNQETYQKMKRKLAALQKEIEEVIEKEETKMKRQQAKRLGDSHNVMMIKNEEEDCQVKRMRPDPGPPPLIRISDNRMYHDDHDDTFDYLQMRMAGPSYPIKKANLTNRCEPTTSWSLSDTEWAMMDDEEFMASCPSLEENMTHSYQTEDEVEIIDEVSRANIIPKTETECQNCCVDRNLRIKNDVKPDSKDKCFTKVEIVWPGDGENGGRKRDEKRHHDGTFISHKRNVGTYGNMNCNIDFDDRKCKARYEGSEDDGDPENEVEIVSEVDVSSKMKAVTLKRQMFAMFKEKADCIIDNTRARAKFDVKPVEPSGSADDPLIVEDEEEEGYEGGSSDENCEMYEDDISTTDDSDDTDNEMSDNYEDEDLREVPEIPKELLAEIENLNSMKNEYKEEDGIDNRNESVKSGKIWKRIAAVFIVTKFFEFLSEKGYKLSGPHNIVSAC